MKKILPLLVLASACLASCGKQDYYGKYQFLLGRQGDDQTRVSIEMELLNTDSTAIEGFKNFNAAFEMSGSMNSGESDPAIDPKELIEIISKVFPVQLDENNVLNLQGSYKVLNLIEDKYGNKVKLAFDLGELSSVLQEYGINPIDIVSNFVISYCNGSSFTFQIPVSLDDIQQQLTWYGYYLDYDPYLKDKVNTVTDLVTLFLEGKIDASTIKFYNLRSLGEDCFPGEKDPDVRFGSHPKVVYAADGKTVVSSEIDEMNEKYEGLFSNTFVYENDGGVAGRKIGSIFEEKTEPGHYFFYPFNDDFDESILEYDVIVKKDIGVLDYDFSQDTEMKLSIATPDYDGCYLCNLKYPTGYVGTFDWNDFYKKPFVFRDFHDIKIELKKE